MKTFVHHLHSWQVLLPIIIMGLISSYWETINIMVSQWLNNDDFSHGMLIIPISLYLVWERRESLKKIALQPDWRALFLMFFSISIYIAGELGAELFTTRVSLIILFIAVLWLLFGGDLIRTLLFPLLFLFLMLPLPGFIYRNLTFPLQILSSKWAVALLQFWGIMVYREGNVIDLGFTQFQVVEACNGLRFILPLLTLGVLFAFWNKRPMWKRIVLVSATIPIAISANVLRIGGTGILANYHGPEVAEGFFHGFSGWVVFMISFALFFGLNRILQTLPGSVSSSGETKSAQHRKTPMASTNNQRLIAAAIALVIILATPFVVEILGKVSPRPLRHPLENFPMEIDHYHARLQNLESDIWERVGGQSYFLADYHKESTSPINFYVAYYEYQRKAGDFIHSPKLCLPGAGWFIELNHTRHLKYPPGTSELPELLFNELIVSKADHSQMVYYWYQGRGRNFTSEYAAKFWMVWDGIWRRRTDGALVRLVRNLNPGESVDDARVAMDRFALIASSELQNYLP